MGLNWSARVSDEEMQRRTGGRNNYNSARQFRAKLRRCAMAADYSRALSTYYARYPDAWRPWGWQKAYARQIGVSASTVCRDMAAILAQSAERFRKPAKKVG